MTAYKLGRLAPAPVPARDLTHYLTKPLPAPPSAVDAPQLDYPMAVNDQLGDCTLAGVVHVDQATADLTREPWTYPGDSTVAAEYFKLTGGQDTGLVEANVLRVWSTEGLFGHVLAAYAPLNVKHIVPIKQAVALMGAVYTGVLVPAPAQQQFAAGQPWALTHTSADHDLIGGHAVPYIGYNAIGPVCVTWGALQQITWEWHLTYCEESYAVITAEIKERGALRGLDFRALDKDLASLRTA